MDERKVVNQMPAPWEVGTPNAGDAELARTYLEAVPKNGDGLLSGNGVYVDYAGIRAVRAAVEAPLRKEIERLRAEWYETPIYIEHRKARDYLKAEIERLKDNCAAENERLGQVCTERDSLREKLAEVGAPRVSDEELAKRLMLDGHALLWDTLKEGGRQRFLKDVRAVRAAVEAPLRKEIEKAHETNKELRNEVRLLRSSLHNLNIAIEESHTFKAQLESSNSRLVAERDALREKLAEAEKHLRRGDDPGIFASCEHYAKQGPGINNIESWLDMATVDGTDWYNVQTLLYIIDTMADALHKKRTVPAGPSVPGESLEGALLAFDAELEGEWPKNPMQMYLLFVKAVEDLKGIARVHATAEGKSAREWQEVARGYQEALRAAEAKVEAAEHNLKTALARMGEEFRIENSELRIERCAPETLKQLANVMDSVICPSCKGGDGIGCTCRIKRVSAVLAHAGAYVDASQADIESAIHTEAQNFMVWLNARIRFRVKPDDYAEQQCRVNAAMRAGVVFEDTGAGIVARLPEGTTEIETLRGRLKGVQVSMGEEQKARLRAEESALELKRQLDAVTAEHGAAMKALEMQYQGVQEDLRRNHSAEVAGLHAQLGELRIENSELRIKKDVAGTGEAEIATKSTENTESNGLEEASMVLENEREIGTSMRRGA